MNTITKRVVSGKRRTLGFIVNNNRRVSLMEAVKMARKGELRGMGVRRRNNKYFVATLPSADNHSNLVALPEVVV